MRLRENQVEPVEVGKVFFEMEYMSPSIIVAPTAFGKSIVIAFIAKEINDKVLVIQPSKELLEQNYEKFTNLGGEASIYSASMGEKEIGHVTYATIGSIVSVAQEIRRLGFKKVIIDECDRYPRGPQGLLRRFVDGARITHILGLTATPLKLQTNLGEDGMSMSKLVMLTNWSKKGTFFKHIIHVAQIQDIVELGYWCKLHYQSYDFDTGELVYNSNRSDYSEKSMERAYIKQNIEQKIIKKVKELTDRKHILVAVPSVAQATDLAGKIPNAAIVHGGTPKKDRKRIINDFRSGKIRVVVQVDVLCLDTNTEILTKTGWVNYNEITYNHEVANWHNGNVYYKNPKNIVIRKLNKNENFISYKSDSIDFRVTDNHDMLVSHYRDDSKFNKVKAIDLIGKKRLVPIHGNYTFENFEIPQEKYNKTYNRRVSANLYQFKKNNPSLSHEECKKEVKKRIDDRLKLKYKNPNELTLEECEFIGFFSGDGTLSGGQYSAVQSFRYSNIIDRINYLLDKMGYSYSKTIKKYNSNKSKYKTINWVFNTGRGFGKQKVNGFYTILPYLNKDGKYLEHFSREQLISYLYGFWLADGNHSTLDINNRKSGKLIHNTNKKLLDKIQSLCAVRNIKSSITVLSKPKKYNHKHLYGLRYNINSKASTINRGKFKIINEGYSDELVWCVTTDSGNIITRRNGKVLVTGNSVGFDFPALDCVITGRPTNSISWWYQFVGRATRIDPAGIKKDAIVVDFVGSVPRFGRIEELYYKEENGDWQLFGEGKKQITGIPMHEIGLYLEGGVDLGKTIDEDGDIEKIYMTFGKYKDKPISSIPPYYRKWMLENIKWNHWNMKIKNEILRLQKLTNY